MSDVVIFAYGSRGDVQPPVNMGMELARRGHHVRVLAPTRYRDIVTGAGLHPEPLRFDPVEILAGEAGQRWQAARDPISFYRGFRTVSRMLLADALEDSARAAEGADLVMAPVMGGVGCHAAEAVGAASIVFHLQPGERTAAFADPLLGRGLQLGPALNRSTHLVVERASWALFGPMVKRWREQRLGLAPIPHANVNTWMRTVSGPALGGFSPSVIPPPRDWDHRMLVTGYWLEPGLPQPGPELARFVASGPAPVYVGFGSMVPADANAVADRVASALGRLGLRGVLLRPHLAGGGMVEASSSANLLVVDDAPHPWLFPRCAAVVHHGGAGTTAAAARAGVPQVICPQSADQWFWSRTVERLGVGAAAPSLTRMSADDLAGCLRRVLDDERPARAARRLARRIAGEDGVRVAADEVERVLDTQHRPGRPAQPGGLPFGHGIGRQGPGRDR